MHGLAAAGVVLPCGLMPGILASMSPRRSIAAQAIAVLAVLAGPGACASPEPSAAASPAPSPAAQALSSELPDRDPALAHRLVEHEGALLLDVRSPEEFAAGHVDGAINVPHTEVAARMPEILALAEGDRGKPVVVYCRSGRRSGLAKDTLKEHGFSRVTNLGAMSDW